MNNQTTQGKPVDVVPENTTAITGPPVGLPTTQLDRLTPAQIDQVVEHQKSVADGIRRLKMVAVRITHGHDWQDMGGEKPYLEGEGGLRLCGPMGIDLEAPEFVITREGSHYFVECVLKGTWRKSGHTITEIGHRDTLDSFFVGDPVAPGERPKMTMFQKYMVAAMGDGDLARIKLQGFLKKAAYMNAVSRVVTALLGIRGVTWDDLAEMGFQREGAGSKVSYRKGADVDQTRKARADKAGGPEVMALAEVINLAAGSRFAVRAKLIEHPRTFPKFTTYSLREGDSSLQIMRWGVTNGKDLDFKPGATLYAECRVKDYQGKPQYVVLDEGAFEIVADEEEVADGQ